MDYFEDYGLDQIMQPVVGYNVAYYSKLRDSLITVTILVVSRNDQCQ